MKILSFTSLWPNHMQPLHGLFVRERMKVVAKHCELKVVAPVPWFLPTKLFGEQYYAYSQVLSQERQGELDVFHPRFLVLPKVGKFLDGWLMYVSLRRFLRGFRRNFHYDLIDAHYGYPDGYAAACLAREAGVPYTVTVRGTDMTLFAHERFRGKLIRKTLEGAAKVICVSRSLQEEVLALGIPREQTIALENGVDPQKFYRIPQAEARQHVNLPQSPRIIVSVGRLNSRKGFHLLIDMLKMVQTDAQGTPVHLIIIGGKFQWEPTYQERLTQQIHDSGLHKSVFLVGKKPPEELRYWYSAADLFCLASASEGCPNVVLESLACGTPVVASAVSGIPDILAVPEIGMAVERTVNGFIEGVTQTLNQNWNHEQIIRYTQEKYSWETTADNVHRIFSEALQEGSPKQPNTV